MERRQKEWEERWYGGGKEKLAMVRGWRERRERKERDSNLHYSVCLHDHCKVPSQCLSLPRANRCTCSLQSLHSQEAAKKGKEGWREEGGGGMVVAVVQGDAYARVAKHTCHTYMSFSNDQILF